MELNKAYPVRKQVPWRAIDTETLVVDVKAGLLFPLNSVATRIWQLCDGRHMVDEIVQIITAEFDADDKTIRQDTAEFIQELLQRKLVSLDKKPQPLSAEGTRNQESDAGG
jgi:Coenzyme PQQ synthesis protein D (PqqD)